MRRVFEDLIAGLGLKAQAESGSHQYQRWKTSYAHLRSVSAQHLEMEAGFGSAKRLGANQRTCRARLSTRRPLPPWQGRHAFTLSLFVPFGEDGEEFSNDFASLESVGYYRNFSSSIPNALSKYLRMLWLSATFPIYPEIGS